MNDSAPFCTTKHSRLLRQWCCCDLPRIKALRHLSTSGTTSRKERQEEDDKKEQERLHKIALEQEAHETQIQELAPKIEAMEASWNRLRTITGADEPEEVIAYWEGLKSKEENMRQLVAASEASEAGAKVRLRSAAAKLFPFTTSRLTSRSLAEWAAVTLHGGVWAGWVASKWTETGILVRLAVVPPVTCARAAL